MRKLRTRYGPVSCIWFDTPQMMTFERGQRFVDLVHGHHDRDWKLPTEILFKLVDTW